MSRTEEESDADLTGTDLAALPLELCWDPEEPTLSTDLSAVIAREMQPSTSVQLGVRQSLCPSPSTFQPAALGTFAGTFAALLFALVFAPDLPPADGHKLGASAGTPTVQLIELPSENEGSPEAATPSLEELAKSGNAEALKALRGLEKDLTSLQVLAIAAGEIAQEHAEIAKDPAKTGKLLKMAEGVRPRIEELAALAALPGPLAADALFEIWSRSLEHPKTPSTQTQDLAYRLLFAPDIRARGSVQIRTVLALYEAHDCASARAAMTAAEAHGDERSTHGVQQIAGGSACEADDDDCQSCVEHRSLTHQAFLAVRARPACPSFRCSTEEVDTKSSHASPHTPQLFAVATKEPHD